MFIVRHRKIFYAISAILLLVSIASFFYQGVTFGIDFSGGSILEVSYDERPEQDRVHEALDSLDLGNYVLQPTYETSYILRTRDLSVEEKTSVMNALSLGGEVEASEERFSSIGPVIGNELRSKALIALAIVLTGIVLFIAYAFRKVSEPISSWKYGFAALIALGHDVVIPSGIYIFLSPYTGGEIDILFVSALLAILGYSVHDTIVVFDRVREKIRLNKEEKRRKEFDAVAGESLEETYGRSINTSLTTFVVLLSLYIFGPESIKNFSLLLVLGILVGTYSSIFVAVPLLATFEKRQQMKKG